MIINNDFIDYEIVIDTIFFALYFVQFLSKKEMKIYCLQQDST